jgi:hypothetical protein
MNACPSSRREYSLHQEIHQACGIGMVRTTFVLGLSHVNACLVSGSKRFYLQTLGISPRCSTIRRPSATYLQPGYDE